MPKFLLACLFLSFFSVAVHAEAPKTKSKQVAQGTDAARTAKTLLKRLKAHHPARSKQALHTLDTPLLSFMPSPSGGAVQGQSLTVLIESINTFTGRILSLDYSVNGGMVQSAPVIDNSTMFAASLGVQSLVGANYLDAKLYGENSANNTDIRTAIKNLDTNINHLTTQINGDRDPVDRAELQEQRSEQIVLKGELVTELRAYRTLIGTQRFTYSVVADPNSPTAPKVTVISPVGGGVHGGNTITITGVNFGTFSKASRDVTVTVLIGGVVSSSATLLNGNQVQAVVPDFGSNVGAKDVELRFSNGSQTSNVIVQNGYYVSSTVVGPPQNPVAIATGGGKISLGSSTVFDGTQSYDTRTNSFDYSWTVVSSPSGSAFVVGKAMGANSTFAFVPDVVGSYVFQLVVTEHDTPEHLVSNPSIAEVYAGNGPKVFANAISIVSGSTGTTQALVDGANGNVFYTISQAPQHGTATVSDSGLVTYSPAVNFSGSDAITLQATDQSGLAGTAVISVIVQGLAPTFSAASIQSHTETAFSLITSNTGVPAQYYTFSISQAATHGTASVDPTGLVTYAPNLGYIGPDVFYVQGTDNQSQLAAKVPVLVTVSANSVPQVSAPALSAFSGQVATDQVTVTDDQGQLGTFSISTSPSNGSASISPSGLITYTSSAGFTGNDSLVVSFTDNGNPALTGTATVGVSVYAPLNASAPAITATGNAPATSQITLTGGADGHTYNYSVTTAPTNGTASVAGSGLVTYTPNNSFSGTDSLVITVADSQILSLFTTITIAVSVNQTPPTASAPSISTLKNTAGTSQISASSGGVVRTYSYFLSTVPNHGFVDISPAGLVTYTPNIFYTGVDSFVVRVSDAALPSLFADVTIAVTVSQPKTPPVASAPQITVAPGVAGTSQVNAFSRTAGQTVSFAISAQPTNGTATISSSGLVTYTPNSGYAGTDSIGVTVTDSGTPPLSTSISIPVMVSSLTPPTLSPILGYSIFGNGVPYQYGLGWSPAGTGISAGNGGVASVTWNFGDGTQENIGDFILGGTFHFYVDPGTYTAVVTVKDKAGLTSSATFPVIVSGTDLEIPVMHVTMSPSTGGAAPLTVSFDASGTTYNSGAITQWRWQFCGQLPDVVTPTPTITHTFTSSCSVRVRALAGAAKTMGSTTINVPVGSTVAGSAPIPQFTVAPAREQVVGSTFTFDSTRSIDANVGGSLTNFVWNFADGSCPSCGGTGPNQTYVYNLPGTHFASLSVTNALGITTPTTLQLWTKAEAGTHMPHEIITASGISGVAPFTVTLSTAPSYAYDGASIISTNWNFNDGTPNQSGTTVTHTFTTKGAYNAVAIITDSDGNSTALGQVISVAPTPPELKSVKDPSSPDPEREMQRQVLSASCAENNGASCYALSQMFEEDGDSYTAGLLKQKACSAGYQPACQR